MGWTRQVVVAAEMLDGIVALLLSLANIAERAAYVSQAKRRTVLAIIRHAEGFTCYAFNTAEYPATDGQASTAIPEGHAGDTPEDAMALALSLRFLALLVRSMAMPQCRVALAFKVRGAGGICKGGAILLAFASTPYLDTS